MLDAGGFARWYVVHTESRTRGRAGVAVVTRAAPLAVRTGLTRRTADAGRWAEADLDVRGRTVTVVSVYVPTGEAGTPRQDEKERFLRAMSRRMTEPRRDPAALALVTGDLNVAHREADLRSLARQPAQQRVPAVRAGGARPVARAARRMGRRAPRARRRPARPVHLVVVARPGVRRRHRLADRPPGSRPARWPRWPAAPRSDAPRRTPSGGATTPPSSSTTTSDGAPARAVGSRPCTPSGRSWSRWSR
ncbi:hypothetical protein GCM10025868_34670 [Angustibacter aerolatus]|uniref:Endonuclease/exonuclease/phosphatase domain-containing protein n=1 Tax=Angustibacter aerolatus TaxID=1162965 RepID=A0ABQ6JMZ4_9ACTN|nr:hypothetical protein GCM10025868_34670 [Angustibacter aerolatus]